MNFRTQIDISPNSMPKIEYYNPIFFIGSCFATNISSLCLDSGLMAAVNPFGVTYNPLSLVEILKIIDKKQPVDPTYFREVGGKWVSLIHHSDFNASTLDELRFITDMTVINAHNFIKASTHIFITLGTSWVYEDKQINRVVNNCHKLPADNFIRRRLGVDEIISLFSDIISNLDILKDKKIVFTVSPIRHIKDSLIGNSLSKSTLIVAVNELATKYPEQVYYFPSYEIMMDDLRDYRFYDSDMLHPSDVAIQYIFEKFREQFFDLETDSYTKKMSKISRAMNHRVIDANSDAHKKFKAKIYSNIENIRREFPNGNYTKALEYFSKV